MKKSAKARSGTGEVALKRRLAEACRMLAAAGQGDDVWGHATARVPGTNTFWMKPAGLGLEEIRPEQLLLVDLDGRVLRGRLPRHSEVFIHAEVFRARPEVNGVVHTHPVPATVFSSLEVPLRPILHEGTNFVPPDVPRFTETSDLIVTPPLGRAVAPRPGSGSPASGMPSRWRPRTMRSTRHASTTASSRPRRVAWSATACQPRFECSMSASVCKPKNSS